jgi:hypothetical protein
LPARATGKLLFPPLGSLAASASDSGAALVIAVDNAAHTAVDDALAMVDALTEGCRFRQDSIRVLRNEEASGSGIHHSSGRV